MKDRIESVKELKELLVHDRCGFPVIDRHLFLVPLDKPNLIHIMTDSNDLQVDTEAEAISFLKDEHDKERTVLGFEDVAIFHSREFAERYIANANGRGEPEIG